MGILTDADRDFFTTNGYLKIEGLIPPEQCEAVIAATFENLEMDPHDPEDWYRDPLPRSGMVEMYQHQALWNTRQNPRLHEALAEVLGTERLWVTIDRVNFKPPPHPDHPEYDFKGFIHWDADSRYAPQRPLAVQGVLYLRDTAEDQGGFQCVPDLYRAFPEWVKTQPEDRDPFRPDMTGFEPVKIPGKQGDYVIWNVMQPHGNARNTSNLPRFAQFISMKPVPEDCEEKRAERIRIWRERENPQERWAPGDPRKTEQRTQKTAELTHLGRKLLGLDEW